MRGKYLAILVAVLVVGLILLGRMGNTLVDWLWFSSIGYEGVFWTIFTARTVLFLVVFAVSPGNRRRGRRARPFQRERRKPRSSFSAATSRHMSPAACLSWAPRFCSAC
jgi:uncharacterized membrane protein (UPF0182 family)